jgi:hypothetical protein
MLTQLIEKNDKMIKSVSSSNIKKQSHVKSILNFSMVRNIKNLTILFNDI